VGYRQYPFESDIKAVLAGRAPVYGPSETASLGELPALVTADWCPFTIPASGFWRQAARRAGVPLRVLDAESEEGAGNMDAVGAAGVPCTIAAPDRVLYGYQYTPLQAQEFLAGSARRPEVGPP
jgi:hypothetical protein